MNKSTMISTPLMGVVMAVTLMGVVGCAAHQQQQHYGFRPTEMVSSSEGGSPASRYAVTPQAPRGEVYVTSFGTREVEGGVANQLIHLRMAVFNQNGEQDWLVDPVQQVLVAPGVAPQPPAYMEIDGKQGTTSNVPRGQRRVFDLYYRAGDVGNMGGFELRWQVSTGTEAFAQNTPFVRQPYDDYETRPRTHVAVGLSPPWWGAWYGPAWGYYGHYGYPYHYGPYARPGFGFYGRGYYGGGGHHRYGGGGGGGFAPRYGGGGGGFGRYGGGGGGGGMRSAPAMRGRPGR